MPYIVIQRDITERKRAEEALRQYIERLRILHAIDGAILAAWSPNATAQAALRHVRRLVPCQRASVVVFDLEAHEAKLIAAHVNGETTVSAGTSLSPEDFGDIQSLQRGRPYMVEDILTLPHPTSMGQTLSDEGVRSHMMLPLITHGELIGILNLGAESPSAFVPEHVDIARELVNNPDVIRADEPTGNLDEKSTDEIMEIFSRLNQEGRTIVIVSHDRTVAEHAQRILELKEGQIFESG